MQETKEHGDAFDAYYAMGENRSFVSVARQCNVSERTIARWAKAFNWKNRIILRDLEINKKVEEKTNSAIVNTKADYRADIAKDREELKALRTRIERLISDTRDKIEAGDIKADNIDDLRKLVTSLKHFHDIERDKMKMDLLLIGEADSSQEIILKLPDEWKGGI